VLLTLAGLQFPLAGFQNADQSEAVFTLFITYWLTMLPFPVTKGNGRMEEF
jgi:hypothetical protein